MLLDKLKKFGTSSASVKCACFIEGARSTELTSYISANKLKIERENGVRHYPLLETGVKYIVDMYQKDSNSYLRLNS